MSREPKRPRPVRSAQVVRTERLSPELVRVVLTGEDLRTIPELEYTDHYVKLLFAPAGADYAWPFVAEEIQATRPRAEWPVTRTYTIRWFDRARNELAIDFVVHGDEGLAGPWAATVQPGDGIGFRGPGGGYAPDPTADLHLFAGDESALPAIAAALDALPEDAPAEVFAEVAGPGCEIDLRVGRGTTVHWLHRGDRPFGAALAEAVRSAPYPEGRLSVFAHGNADTIKELRRYFYVERGLDRSCASISGYWRTNHTEDAWQASKHDFVAAMDEAEQVAAARS